jgi:hypothetical protein
MMERTDLTALSYEDWLTYIFAHECDPESPLERTPWYLEDNFGARIGNPHVLVDYVGRMCLQFSGVAQRYSLPQVDHGIKFVLSAAGLWFREYPGVSLMVAERDVDRRCHSLPVKGRHEQRHPSYQGILRSVCHKSERPGH